MDTVRLLVFFWSLYHTHKTDYFGHSLAPQGQALIIASAAFLNQSELILKLVAFSLES